MRNTNSGIVLWQMRNSDYPGDMRNSYAHKDLRLRRFFVKRGGVRALANALVLRPGATRPELESWRL